jgi:hypothetical protein
MKKSPSESGASGYSGVLEMPAMALGDLMVTGLPQQGPVHDLPVLYLDGRGLRLNRRILRFMTYPSSSRSRASAQ